MNYRLNDQITRISTPPIAQARSWLRPDSFGPDMPLLDLSQAVPSYPPAPAISEALSGALQEHDTAFYTDITGVDDLREAIAARMGGNSDSSVDNVRRQDVAVTAGCNQAFCTVMQALAGPGDNVILPLPWYFNHRMWLDALGVTANPVPFREDAGGIPDPGDIEAAINDRTRAIALVTPNNPTGAVYSPEYLTTVNDIARRNNIALVVDETYRDFLPMVDGVAPSPHNLFADDAWRDSFIQLYSFSKVFSLTGYRVGAIVANPDFISEVAKILDCVTICPTAIGQKAALAGLRHGESFIAQKRNLMAERVAAIRSAFDNAQLRAELVTSGAYFAYMRHGFTDMSSEEVAIRLAGEQNLLTLPGSMFGPGQEQYLRLAFANVDASQFNNVTDRIRNAEASW